ncbi:unnamed protein product, partial [Rotaria sp. Silwood2]
MEKTEYRAVIKFFVLEGLSATEIHTKMVKVLKESAPSFPTVHRWVLEFKRGRTSVEEVKKIERNDLHPVAVLVWACVSTH